MNSEITNKKHLISVIIPTYNNEKFILRSINSVLNQTYNNIECLVIDDGSTDRTKDILNNLISNNSIKYYKKKNGGVSSARNYGLQVSNGNYIVFLDADDILLENALDNMYNYIIYTDANLCVGLEKNKSLAESFPYKDNFLANLVSNWWPVSSVMVKKGELRWNENRKTWEVIEYFAEHLLNDPVAVICPYEVTEIDHNFRKDRTTILFDHYNDEETFNFFAKLKGKIKEKDRINHGISEAIDYLLLSNAYSTYCKKKYFPKLFQENLINQKVLNTYKWYKKFGLSGFSSIFGLKKGIFIFFTINKFLNRL